ncbi:YSIRK-type signal peptide-containing protein, partial [Streptococcus mitis]|uniref:YSIRK-type signal peptide-containing protein n=1 Tax=Streptococcus mitis TaxID=28037 RepID=UPI0039C10B7F
MFHKGKHDREKQLRFSIRKVSFGAASVAVAALFMFLGNGAVSAAEQGVPSTHGETLTPQPKDQNIQNGTYEGNTVANSPAATVETNTQPLTVENSPSPESAPQKVETLDKKELTDLIKEIDGKLAQGTYATKTEESVNNLRTVLEEARTTLNNAKTQAELSQAQAKLVTATTKLQTKPEEKKEAPAVDTTNGKATVGKKATNTEKSSESNSIANSASKDERNGKILDTNNPFRTDTTPSTTDDTSANQVFDNPAEGADVKTLSNKLESLPEAIQNNTKIQDMNDLGDKTGVARGDVKEINEFGGWKAINQPDGTEGKFAIARKTDKGVFPIETVNTVYNDGKKSYDTYVGEQAFDRTKEYMLFLGKVRTIASAKEETFNGQPYQRTGLGGSDSFGIKSFSGIEKTFKAHSPATGSKVKVSFKTGFTGDLNGTKAKYLVEVVYRQNGSEVTAYTYTFAPQPSGTVKNKQGIVTPAKDGTGKPYIRSNFNDHNLNRAEVEAKMAEDAYKPNGQAGTFTSSDIDLPVGVTEYTVRIKVTDTERMGMGYQSPLRHYALPVTGTDFSIEQDTKNVAKDLLQRIYNRLVEQKSEDTKWSTSETKGAYETKLTEINALLNSGINTTSNYKESAKSLIEKYNSLNNRDTIIAAAKADLAEAAKAEKAEIAADKSLTEAERKEKETAVDTKKAEE